jgi:hypothetical protein
MHARNVHLGFWRSSQNDAALRTRHFLHLATVFLSAGHLDRHISRDVDATTIGGEPFQLL